MVKTEPVKATPVEDIDNCGNLPGAFEIVEAGDTKGMWYICPCGCGMHGYLPFRPEASPSWDWDGNREKPTLHPSIHHLIMKRTHWHGWLRNGVWTSC